MLSLSVEKNNGEVNLNEIIDLVKLSSEHLHHNALGDHAWLDLTQGGRSSIAGYIARETGHSHIVGYAQISQGSNSWALEYVIHPGHYDDCVQIGTLLLKQALEEIKIHGGGHVHVWVPKPDHNSDLIALNNNMSKGRQVIQMRRDITDLKSPQPTEVLHQSLNAKFQNTEFTISSLRTKQDESDWLELNNTAFGQHPEQGNWDQEIFNQRKNSDWFDAEGLLLCRHRDSKVLSASCWVKIHNHHQNRFGEIYVIAVSPRFQGQKLGKMMLEAGLIFMKSRLLNSAMLYVDSTNVKAIGMYEKFGFTKDHNDQAYVMDIPQ